MKTIASIVFILACTAVVITTAVGYVANIVFLIKAASAAAFAQVAVSVVGIFMAPIGGLHGLGWLVGWW